MNESAYRAFPGIPRYWEVEQQGVLRLLKKELGMQPCDCLLEIGAGCLRLALTLVPYLEPSCYCAIEPNTEAVETGLKRFPSELLREKKPCFCRTHKFELSEFDRKFDFVLAHNVFIHCGHAQFRACLKEMPAVLKDAASAFVCSLYLLRDEEQQSGEQEKYPHASHCHVTYAYDTVESVAATVGLRIDDVIFWGRGTEFERQFLHHFVFRKA